MTLTLHNWLDRSTLGNVQALLNFFSAVQQYSHSPDHTDWICSMQVCIVAKLTCTLDVDPILQPTPPTHTHIHTTEGDTLKQQSVHHVIQTTLTLYVYHIAENLAGIKFGNLGPQPRNDIADNTWLIKSQYLAISSREKALDELSLAAHLPIHALFSGVYLLHFNVRPSL